MVEDERLHSLHVSQTLQTFNGGFDGLPWQRTERYLD